MSVLEQTFEIPQFLYYRIEDSEALEKLRDYFFDYEELSKRFFSAFDLPGVERFSKKVGFEGFHYVAGGIAQSPGDADGAIETIPQGWVYANCTGKEIIPDAASKGGETIAHRLDKMNDQLKTFYSSYKDKVLNMIGWPLRLAEIDVSDEHYIEADVSAFDLFISSDQSALYLKINNPDYFRDTAVFDGAVSQNICHNVANELASWDRPDWLVPTTEDEVKRHTMGVGVRIEHTSSSFKQLRNNTPSP